ncbi:hypothetical protein MAUB1S_08390 [Mycolicibacterium aubagnense]
MGIGIVEQVALGFEAVDHVVMAGLGAAVALLTGFIFFCFAWSVLTL